MEKKFYLFLSLFLLLGFTGFAQFEQVAQLTEFPDVQHTTSDELGSSIAVDGAYVVSGTKNHLGIGAVYVYYNNGVTFETLAILTPSDGNLGDQFGASVAISGDVIVVGAPYNDLNGSEAGAVYVFEKPSTGWADMTETVRLSATDVNATDYFGKSVSIEAAIIVVGAHIQNNTGAVYVYEKPSAGWAAASTQTAKLVSSDIAAGDYFGYAVDIDSDIIVVGAYQDDDAGTGSGSAYVFEKPESGWANGTETAKLTASNAAASDYFGQSVSVSGTTIVVGAYSNDGLASNAGMAYVFEKPGSGWASGTETAQLTASDAAIGDLFGQAVNVFNEVIAVGAYFDDLSSGDMGSVYVFEKPSLGWNTATETAKINPSDAFVSDFFGISIALDGDFLVVGAIGVDNPWYNQGAAYVFEKPSAGWAPCTEIAELFSRDHSNINQLFMGKSVAMDGNIAVVSSGHSTINLVEVLEFYGDTWHKVAILEPSDGNTDDYFGESLAISGDVIVVGAPNNDLYGSDAGAAYVFEKPLSGWADMTETVRLSATDVDTYDYFGKSVSIEAAIIVVGAYYQNNTGAVYVYEKPSAGWAAASTQTAKLVSSDIAAYDYFGYAVDIDSDIIVVGASQDSDAGSSSGSAYVFEKPVSGWANGTETAKLTASNAAASDYFGQSVSVSGTTIVVGAWTNDEIASNAGMAYVYEKPSSGWISNTETAQLTASDATSNDYFGFAVSISGNWIAIGAKSQEVTGVYQGAAYIFEKPSAGWISTTVSQKIVAGDHQNYYSFANAIAITSNYILVGSNNANYDDSNASGSAYLFQAPLTWTGAVNNDWHTASNWDFNKEPLFYDDVFIDPGTPPTITSEANCYDIEMGPTAQMFIESSALDVNGSFIFGGDFIGTEIIEYRRYIQSDRWQMIGSPLSGQTINRFLTIPGNTIVSNSGNYQMKDYNEATDNWTANYTSATAGNVELGKGYVVERGSDGVVTFEGVPNNAVFNATLTRNGMGWNLIGNPFTSAIATTINGTDSEDYLLNATNLAVLDPSYAALYVWVEDIEDPSNLDNYKIINNAGSGSLAQDYLQVGQGFFVKAATGGGSFAITPAMQSHQIEIPFKAIENVNWTGIELTAESVEGKVKTNISYNEAMTPGLDVSYDAGSMNSHPNFTMYSKLIDDNGENFALQCLPTDFENLVVPIGMEAEAGNAITFKAEVSNLPEDYVAVIEDRQLGTFTKLESGADCYTISLENALSGTGRFYLRTSFKNSVGVDDLNQNSFRVFAQANSNQLLINGLVEENTTAIVYDLQGRLVQHFELQNGTQNRITFNQESGVYVIKIQNSKGLVNQKFNWVK